MSLVELITQADERALAAGGLACLDRCLPLLDGDDDMLRPLWASLADGSDWAGHLEKARAALTPAANGEEDEATRLARQMLDTAPAERTAAAVRPWADTCSVASLRIHRLLDPAANATGERTATGADGTDGAGGADGADGADGTPAGDLLAAGRAGDPVELPPLVAAELRRQITVLELLSGHGAHGLRRALDVSVEGRRVLRAVVSRRARVGGAPGA